MKALNELITAAVQLAGADDLASHNARLWQMEGGRACPLGWGGCSQPVYVDVKTGAYDYGEPGGPGHADCVRNCKHGMQPFPEDDDGDLYEDPECPRCHGDGMDPWNDYMFPCPLCQGEQRGLAPNAELRGASQLAGAASRSNAGLGAGG